VTAAPDPLLAWRGEFPILDRTTYLVSHSLGAMPRAAAERLKEYTDTWAARGVRAWAEGWWRMPITVGDAVGRIIGAPPASVVPRLSADALFPPGSGHPTPKVDVRAVIVRGGRVLLVRERTDGGWAMPGGWADPGLSPAQIAVKETAEEAGLEVRATRLLALWDRDAQGMQPYAHAVYKAYLACVAKAHLTAGTWAALYRCGGIDKPWTPGDNVNLAVGQGDVQVTPLQLAVARQQMKEIRALQQSSVRNVDWTKPLTMPALVLSAMLVLTFVAMMWK